MFAYLSGEIAYKSPSHLHLDIGGMGYEIQITLNTYNKIQKLDHCKLYTHLQIKEDAWVIFGFAEESERATFRQLLSITGVGSNTARIILSSLNPNELANVIAHEEVQALEKIKGIGAKTAQRIILELKGKLQITGTSTTVGTLSSHNNTVNDALNALVNLGIPKNLAENALRKIKEGSDLPVEGLIKEALRLL